MAVLLLHGFLAFEYRILQYPNTPTQIKDDKALTSLYDEKIQPTYGFLAQRREMPNKLVKCIKTSPNSQLDSAFGTEKPIATCFYYMETT